MMEEELRYVQDIGMDLKLFLQEKNIHRSEITPIEEWRAEERNTEEERNSFYEESERYIFTLLWLCIDRYPIRNAAAINVVDTIHQQAIYRDMSILDYGCGLGDIGFRLATKGYQVTFVDLDTLTFEFVKWRCEKYGVEAKFITLPNIIHQLFDVVICLEVLEHVDDPELLLATLKTVLKNDGQMIISESMKKAGENPLHIYRTHNGSDVLPKWMKKLEMRATAFFEVWEPTTTEKE
jgi:2-polyprenyl-3-methyl-5-hydroxy-6-metoxy-1,4-benzoquinol methylase